MDIPPKPTNSCSVCKGNDWWWQQHNYNPRGSWVCVRCHPLVKCMECGEVILGMVALEHTKETKHNLWEIDVKNKGRNKGKK